METPITKLRNLMGPIVNYFKLKSKQDYFKIKSNQDSLTPIPIKNFLKLIDKEQQRCQDNIPQIREILNTIPDDACDKPKMRLWEVDFVPLWPVGHCLIILAETEEEARKIADIELSCADIVSITEVPMDKSSVVICIDGNY